MKKQKKDKVGKQKNIKKFTKAELQVLRHNVEAILFAAGKSLKLSFIADLCNATKSQVGKQLLNIQKEYNDNSVLMVIEQGDSWKMTVREQYLDIVRKIVADTELGKTVLETLSMIAYRSPALQSDIVKARGVVTYDHVAELVNLGFVIKEKIGRSFILKLSEKFYEYFELDGKKIKEVFQPIKERADEQLLLGNMKIVDAKNDSSHKKDIFDKDKSQEERLGDLEVVRVENQEAASQINSIRDNHQGFLDSIENQINEISDRTDLEEKDIEEIKSSDVQGKIEEIKDEQDPSIKEDSAVINSEDNGIEENKEEKEDNSNNITSGEMLDATENAINELNNSKKEDFNKSKND